MSDKIKENNISIYIHKIKVKIEDIKNLIIRNFCKRLSEEIIINLIALVVY